MSEDWPAHFTKLAEARVDAFLAARPGATRHGVVQPGQGATNRVIFAREADRTIVRKVFCETERKERESFGLRHWHSTGLVPEVLWEADPIMIVMSYVPGWGLHEERERGGYAGWRQACREVGRAMGTLAGVPLAAADQEAFESRFYGQMPTLEAYVGLILDLGRKIQDRDPDFRDHFWKDELDFIEAHLPTILAQPPRLYHQDVGNLHVQHGGFVGFYDLEMCRVGCAAMQVGSSLGLLQGRREALEALCAGWEEATGAALATAEVHAIAAAQYLLDWREISRYLSYDGTPGTGYEWAEPADPVRYRSAAEAVREMLKTGA